jgi:phage terminase small subunit
MPELSDPKLETFAVQYATHRSHPHAAHLAGYPPGIRSETLLRKPEVVQRVQEIWGEAFEAAQMTPKMVMEELRRIAFQDIRPIFDREGNLKPVHLLDDDVAATIASVDVEVRWEGKGDDAVPITTKKVRRVDKMAALNILARHFKIVGDDNEGVNALASALAERLKAGRNRRMGLPPSPTPMAEEVAPPPIELADPAGARPGERIVDPVTGVVSPIRSRLAHPQPLTPSPEEQDDERLW